MCNMFLFAVIDKFQNVFNLDQFGTNYEFQGSPDQFG